jgi:hypothetical protein
VNLIVTIANLNLQPCRMYEVHRGRNLLRHLENSTRRAHLVQRIDVCIGPLSDMNQKLFAHDILVDVLLDLKHCHTRLSIRTHNGFSVSGYVVVSA